MACLPSILVSISLSVTRLSAACSVGDQATLSHAAQCEPDILTQYVPETSRGIPTPGATENQLPDPIEAHSSIGLHRSFTRRITTSMRMRRSFSSLESSSGGWRSTSG